MILSFSEPTAGFVLLHTPKYASRRPNIASVAQFEFAPDLPNRTIGHQLVCRPSRNSLRVSVRVLNAPPSPVVDVSLLVSMTPRAFTQ
jgi:hypothetical protein